MLYNNNKRVIVLKLNNDEILSQFKEPNKVTPKYQIKY